MRLRTSNGLIPQYHPFYQTTTTNDDNDDNDEEFSIHADRFAIPADGKNWFKEKKWTSDRVRRIMQQHSERLLGYGAEYEDEDGIDDEASDLQAGHGTYVAGMIYARELQQGLGGTAMARERFREVSTKWHGFFDFHVRDAAQPGKKRKREPFESDRDEARYDRLHKLQQVNISGQLQQIMGRGTEFRGQQSSVIRAVIAGDTPIVQITSTGGGKSLSFMLPAYCSPHGTTIVIVPLVALQQDLFERCIKLKITAIIWKSGHSNPPASVVFVTPVSAVAKGFEDFVRRFSAQV
ncbi:hypothetical protein E4U47_005546 [Claviceps purpurea]|nr:hypothetical protein E4U47_005546 [Claviceps purpurea]